MTKCVITNCIKENTESENWCLSHLIKIQTCNNLIPCSFCYQAKVPTNKNFYVRNRYQVRFWNTKFSPVSFICFDCLYDTCEIEIIQSKRAIYRTYKWRYYQQSRNKPKKIILSI